MKISVTLDVEVDPAAWDRDYGTGTEPKVIVDDVLGYVLEQVQQGAAAQSKAIVKAELWEGR